MRRRRQRVANNRLEHELAVRCPLGQAATNLVRFFASHERTADQTLRLELEVAASVSDASPPLQLGRAVTATIGIPSATEATPRFDVRWCSADPGSAASFVGEIGVCERADRGSFTLSVRGDYAPPVGFASHGTDDIAARVLAHATAERLLCDIRDGVERALHETTGDALADRVIHA